MPSLTSPTTPFPLYLLPTLPFRRRSSASTASSTSPTSPCSSFSASPPTPTCYLSTTPTSQLQCHTCLLPLCPATSIISKGFTGRHGRAYLVSAPTSPTARTLNLPLGDLPNTHTHKPVPRQLVTGAHTVSDISCIGCGTGLGWKYVDADEEGQKYKVGKFILETKRVVRGAGWDSEGELQEEEGGEVRGNGKAVEEEIEFDSQDEDECEDLFSGIWSPALARKRRKAKKFGRG